MAANRLQHHFLRDFTAGVNLRADAFQLAENELDGVCNMEIDPRGGCYARPGWRRWNSVAVDTPWDPRNAFLFTRSASAPMLIVANDNALHHSTNGTFSQLATVVASAEQHQAAFAQWGDNVYIATGKLGTPYRWSGTGAATALTGVGPTWSNDYTAPVGGLGVKAEHIVTHFGYMFVANTREDGVNYPNRLRWSHSNAPEDFHQDDFHDFLDLPRITAIIPYRDHLLVFGPNSVRAFYGYDSVSWQVTAITDEAGAFGIQHVTRSESAIYFFSWPDGVFAYDGSKVEEISLPLRPIFLDGRFNGALQTEVFLGWLNRRLWFTAPYSEVSGSSTIFVFDPTLGAWTAHVGADLEGLGPFVQDVASNTPRYFGCSRSSGDVMQVDQGSTYTDEHGGVETPYQMWFVTRWVDNGLPDHKKAWKRPTFVTKEYDLEYQLGYEVFHNYDEARVKRSKALTVDTGSDTALYGDGSEYGDGTVYGTGAAGAHVEKGGSLGTAFSVQLLVRSTLGRGWGVNGINFKWIPRRYR